MCAYKSAKPFETHSKKKKNLSNIEKFGLRQIVRVSGNLSPLVYTDHIEYFSRRIYNESIFDEDTRGGIA